MNNEIPTDFGNISIFSNLILEQFKMDMLIQHSNSVSKLDIFYEDIKLNECKILLQVFKLIGFPFFGEEMSENFKPLFDSLLEYYYDNILYEEHLSINALKNSCQEYAKWLINERQNF